MSNIVMKHSIPVSWHAWWGVYVHIIGPRVLPLEQRRSSGLRKLCKASTVVEVRPLPTHGPIALSAFLLYLHV